MKVAIVIPAFNEAGTIGNVVESVSAFGTAIVVDDHSRDESAAIAEHHGAIVVRHSSNKGYDAALESGFAAAASSGSDIAISFDADGQHDAKTLPAIIGAFENDDVAMVLGTRPAAARLAERVFSTYARWRFGIPDILCGLKAYRMALYKRRGHFDRIGSIGTELALASAAAGERWVPVGISVRPRTDTPRIGSAFRANCRIFGALVRVIWADIRGWR